MAGYIAIEGNIGAGKTTLSNLLSRMLGLAVLPEPHEQNEFLPKMYLNMQRWAFSTQVSFLYLRSQSFFKSLQSGRPFIVDRSLFSDRYVFAQSLFEQNFMTLEEYNMYQKWADWFEEEFWGAPLAVIYVHCPLQILMNRIKQRGREMEKVITIDYLKNLEEKHQNMLKRWKDKGITIFEVDSGKIDFTVTYTPEIEWIANRIREILRLHEPVVELIRFNGFLRTKPLYLAIEGNIASGKTTFATHLAEILDARLVSEPWETNPFLELQYQSPQKWAFCSQMKFLQLRAKAVDQALQERPSIALFDRTYLSERYAFGEVLSEQVNLHPLEMQLYQDFFDMIIPKLWPKFDAVIYLRTEVSTLMERIRLRNREIERHISEEFIQKLQDKLDTVFIEDRYNLKLPIIKVNSGKVDFRSREEVLSVIKQIPFPNSLVKA